MLAQEPGAGPEKTIGAATHQKLPDGTPADEQSDPSAPPHAAATLTQFAWLAGNWTGTWGPRSTQEVWTEPKGGTMTGLLRVNEGDRTLVIELLSLVENSGGVELRIRHFTPDLTPWEQGAASRLILTSLTPQAVTFASYGAKNPQRMIFTRLEPNAFIFRSEIDSDSSNTQASEITFHREGVAQRRRANGGSAVPR